MPILIEQGSTRVAITIEQNNPATTYLRSVTEKMLTDHEFNPRIKRMIPTKRYISYDRVKQKLYLPTNMTQEIMNLFDDMGFEYKLVKEPFYETRDIKVKMKSSFVPREHQVPVIDYLNKIEPYRKGLAIQTGSGKTVSSIAGMIAYGKVGMIVVSKLHHQWAESLYQFTDIKSEQLCIIQGFQSLAKVIESEVKPEVFVFSLETLRAYCLRQGHYADIPSFEQFVKYFGIGTKIMDEVHLNFHADTLIDLSCNIPNNIYLTATFTSGNPGTRKIFNMIYPPEMRFGNRVLKKYTRAYCYGYRGNVPEKRVVRQRGYSHVKYEQYLLKRPTFLNDYLDRIISQLVYSHYINKKQDGQKLAVFFSTIEMVDEAYKWFKNQFKDLKVTKFIGGTKDEVLKKNDIIITTPKSMSVGTDVKNLLVVINTVSTKSPPAVLQICGRLREIPGVTTEFIELCDVNLSSHKRHQREREQILKPTVIEYKKCMIY